MKAEMSKEGVITLRAETEIETYALNHWINNAQIRNEGLTRPEPFSWRCSKLIVDTHPINTNGVGNG